MKALFAFVLLIAIVALPAASAQDIPDWIKNVAEMWSKDMIDDGQYLAAIEWLVKEGIIRTSASGADVSEITIGFIPVEKAENITSKPEALGRFLEAEMGVGVNIEVPTSYESIIEGMRFGHIDAAFMDTGPGAIAHMKSNVEVVMAEVVKGKRNYQATVWARADNTNINSLNDTVGKRVAFTSMTGSSGFILPVGTLVAGGQIALEGGDITDLIMGLENSFESHSFAGGYKAALELLINDKVDVAFGSDVAPELYLDLEDQKMLRKVATIGPVPSHVLVVSEEMSQGTKEALVSAMIKLNYDENNQILRDLYGAEALLPTTTAQHIGNFGDLISSLSGLEQEILDKYNKTTPK